MNFRCALVNKVEKNLLVAQQDKPFNLACNNNNNYNFIKKTMIIKVMYNDNKTILINSC